MDIEKVPWLQSRLVQPILAMESSVLVKGLPKPHAAFRSRRFSLGLESLQVLSGATGFGIAVHRHVIAQLLPMRGIWVRIRSGTFLLSLGGEGVDQSLSISNYASVGPPRLHWFLYPLSFFAKRSAGTEKPRVSRRSGLLKWGTALKPSFSDADRSRGVQTPRRKLQTIGKDRAEFVLGGQARRDG